MSKKLKVLFASFEAAPFIKTGGLGDVAAALPGAVQCPTVDIRVVLPKLSQIGEDYKKKMRFVCSFYVPLGWRSQYCGLFELRRGGVTWYFLDNEFYFNRPAAYGYFDDGVRRCPVTCQTTQSIRRYAPYAYLYCRAIGWQAEGIGWYGVG